MAKQTLTRHTCDRCLRPYAEVDPPANAPKVAQVPQPKLHIQLERFEENPDPQTPGLVKHDVVSFDDLCPKCHGRVSDLVTQIKLRPDDDAKGLDPVAKPSDKQGKPEVSPKAPDPKTTH